MRQHFSQDQYSLTSAFREKWSSNYKVDISLGMAIDQVVGVELYLTCFYSSGSYNHLKKY